MLQVQRFVGRLVVSALDGERRSVDAHLHRRRPVGVHLPVLMMIALKLKLQIRPVKHTQSISCHTCTHHQSSNKTNIIYKHFHERSPHHEGLIDGVSQLEDMVADGQVVLQSKGLQHDPVSYRKGQTQVITGVAYSQGDTIRLKRIISIPVLIFLI